MQNYVGKKTRAIPQPINNKCLHYTRRAAKQSVQQRYKVELGRDRITPCVINYFRDSIPTRFTPRS